MEKGNPSHVITDDGKLYTFKAWCMFSFGDKTWPGIAAADKDGDSYGIPTCNITTMIYAKDAKSTSDFNVTVQRKRRVKRAR